MNINIVFILSTLTRFVLQDH